MTWQNQSRRRSELPPNWTTIRAYVLHRDHHTCTIRGDRCTITATEVDHIGDRHDHSPSNLRAACRPCHGTRTARQSHEARRTNSRLPAEEHPNQRGAGGG